MRPVNRNPLRCLCILSINKGGFNTKMQRIIMSLERQMPQLEPSRLEFSPVRKVFFILLISLAAISSAKEKCTIPTPDGVGVENISAPNLTGYFHQATETSLTIIEYRSQKPIKIRTNKSQIYFSAFGGDEISGNINRGVAMRIWFVNCKPPANKTLPSAAYVEFYSNNVLDKPEKSYFLVNNQTHN